MKEFSKCLKCGGTNLTPGNLAVGYVGVPVCMFRPEGASGRSYKKHNVVVKGTMCLDCGFVEISGDPAAGKAAIKGIKTD